MSEETKTLERPISSRGSESDVFAPTGRTRIHVTWELSVKEVGKGKCEFTNRVRSYATEEMLTFLARQGIPFDQFSRATPTCVDRP
jgi:hypothetical protein